jgi:hypothetical protein
VPQFAQALAYYVYFEEEPGRGARRRTSSPGRGICLAQASKRGIAANIAKLPDLLRGEPSDA